jgi:hypothetical protein
MDKPRQEDLFAFQRSSKRRDQERAGLTHPGGKLSAEQVYRNLIQISKLT